MDRNGCSQGVLGDAKEAVERRKTRVGVIRLNQVDNDTDTRCPDRMEVQLMKDLEENLRLAREATQRGVGRYAWSGTRMSAPAPMTAPA